VFPHRKADGWTKESENAAARSRDEAINDGSMGDRPGPAETGSTGLGLYIWLAKIATSFTVYTVCIQHTKKGGHGNVPE